MASGAVAGRAAPSKATPAEPTGSVAHGIRLIRPFFDAALYTSEYPDVTGTPEELLLHFCERGWKEGRNPNAGFDTVFYLERHPDVDLAGWNPYYHFIFQGYKENRKTLPAVMPRETTIRILGRDLGGWVELMRTALDVKYYESQFVAPFDRTLSHVAHFAFRGWLSCKRPVREFDIATAIGDRPDLYQERFNPYVLTLCETTSDALEADETDEINGLVEKTSAYAPAK